MLYKCIKTVDIGETAYIKGRFYSFEPCSEYCDFKGFDERKEMRYQGKNTFNIFFLKVYDENIPKGINFGEFL